MTFFAPPYPASAPDMTAFALKVDIPKGATTAPPSVADDGSVETDPMTFAMGDHTHASKVRTVRAVSASDGTLTWNFTPPFPPGSTPKVVAIAEAGASDVVSVQSDGIPTATQVKLRVIRTVRSVVSLLGLTILSLPASTGAVPIHAMAFET